MGIACILSTCTKESWWKIAYAIITQNVNVGVIIGMVLHVYTYLDLCLFIGGARHEKRGRYTVSYPFVNDKSSIIEFGNTMMKLMIVLNYISFNCTYRTNTCINCKCVLIVT